MNSIALLGQDTKTRELLIAIVVSLNTTFEEKKIVLPWVSKY